MYTSYLLIHEYGGTTAFQITFIKKSYRTRWSPTEALLQNDLATREATRVDCGGNHAAHGSQLVLDFDQPALLI